VTFDISEQRESDERLSLSERRYRALVESTDALVWSASPQGGVHVDPAQWERFTGLQLPDELETGWLEAVHPDDRATAQNTWLHALSQRLAETEFFRMRRPDGIYRMVSAQAVPLYGTDGSLQEWFGTTTDVHSQHEARAAIEERNLRLTVAMQAAKMTIVSLDLANWSIALEGDLTRESNAQYAGNVPPVREMHTYQAAMARVHPDDSDKLDQYIRQLANGGEPGPHFEFRISHESGERWMEGSALLQRREDGKPLRIIGSLINITERKNMELMLRETDKRKDEFLAMLAHELRNPLAPLRTAIALLQKASVADPHVIDLVDLMQRQVEHMTRIVDDLLEVSRITQGRITLKQEEILVGSAVYGAVEAIASMVEARAQQIEVDVPEATTWVLGDPTRLSQILVNILNNASKYTPEGGRIAIRVRADGEFVSIVIEDTGTGISADLLPNVFELFSQGDRTLDRSNGGLGIGLSLVRKLVEMHAGTITVESPGPGCGTTVTVRLPRLHHHERHFPSVPVVSKIHEASDKRRILIVDDNRDAADSLAMLCETDAHETCVAYASAEALECAQTFRPDVALLDIGLPDIDGYELATRLRHKGETHPVLIAITGYGQADDRLRAQTAGFDYHFVKPVDVEKLLSLLASLPNPA
jgi:PAS domain S-box-containing protein